MKTREGKAFDGGSVVSPESFPDNGLRALLVLSLLLIMIANQSERCIDKEPDEI